MPADRVLDVDVAFQLRIWGHAYTGAVIEPGALTAEFRPRDRTHAEALRLCDHTRIHLTSQRIYTSDTGWRSVPEHWALPWVTEHRMRQEMADGD